ncbi:interferon-induced very large GTPase 1-like [Ruditapes philippinarum]|uniref:interferon-induced very large GTPase 1-like n=1 Tax=Ruditapes philippinarum TaxID=129788 RepID=UPI00295A626B|nr:interferon-induced very large GTPase 1-like [Ruditapes philippinarum]
MGVDIQTYRARIGTYSHFRGSDVTTVPNISDELKTVGCVLFIGILLMIAGIELNPGPKEEERINVTSAKTSRIKISQLKKTINKEVLKSFFENEQNCGGQVKNIKFDNKTQSAIIEFENNSAVNRILDNKPLKIDGIEVEVDNLVHDSIGAQIDYAYDAQGDETTDQQFDYDDEHAKLLSAVAEASQNDNESPQIGNDGESLGDETIDQRCGSDFEYANESETAGATSQTERKTTEGGVRKRLASFFSSAKKLVSETVTSKVTRKNPAKNNTKESDSSRQAASTETGGDEFYQLLQRLELTATFPGKISLRDVIAIDFDESNVLKNSTINLPDIPWLLLKRLMCVHSESRDITVSESDEHALDLEHSLSFCSEVPGENQNISPLDIFTVVFQCCDPVLKQVIVQKLYLCKLAVPFLYQHWENNTKQSPTLSIWPLRFLVIENKQTPTNIHQKQDRECDVLELPTKVLAFGRLGHSRFSKSKLINSFLLSQGCNTFFNRDCPSGMFSRHISNGQIEMFWLPTIDKSKDIFNHAMTFLNLRGDLGKHFSPDILYFIANFIDSIVMVVELDIVLNQSKIVEDVLLQFSSVILIIPDHLNKDAVNLVKSFHSGVILLKPNISLRILSTHIRTVEQNVVDMLSRITKNILDLLEKNKTMSLEERLSQANLATIKTDEEDDVCQQCKIEASKLMEQMKAEGEPSGWKQHLTPVHSNFSKQLGKLLKERERERDFVEGGNIDVKIMTVRRQQIKSITKYVKSFIHVLIKNRDHPLILNYFLCWLHFQIEREKRQIFPCLVHAIRIAWEKLKSLKCAEEKVKDEIIEKQETAISDLEEQLDKESFTIQHFFREIGHINEAILELKEDTTELGLPTLHHMSNIVSRLVVDGHHFELIDGESFYMTYQWNKAVLNNVDSCIESSKVMTLGVLGLQSSGKSTLLNTMFGSRFPSRTGRCTRGIHVQLIPIKSTNLAETTLSFSYVLIVDTEGLRSPQLSHLHHEHDNELATIITGLGDITMLTIMGENTS